jgi:hypothetical protein
MSNPTTDDFEYFFNTQTWINEDNVPIMIERFDYVEKKYPQLINFAVYIYTNYKSMAANAFNNRSTRDEAPITDAADTYYYNKLLTNERFDYIRRRDYVRNYYYWYVLTKTIEFLYTYKHTKDVVDLYIYYAKNILKLHQEVDQAYDDLQKMFVPLPEKRKLASSPVRRISIRNSVGTERQVQREPDIFFSLRPENKGLYSYNKNDINYSRNDGCKPDCLNTSNTSDKGCCKEVTDAFNTIASNLKNTIARNFTPKYEYPKLKREGGKTRNKNKKHYSRRCKNRKNKKSCKKPHK